MQGHTSKATINGRRPMTDGMRDLLRRMPKQRGEFLTVIALNGTEKNQMRALADRGYVEWHIDGRKWSITEAGRVAI